MNEWIVISTECFDLAFLVMNDWLNIIRSGKLTYLVEYQVVDGG